MCNCCFKRFLLFYQLMTRAIDLITNARKIRMTLLICCRLYKSHYAAPPPRPNLTTNMKEDNLRKKYKIE